MSKASEAYERLSLAMLSTNPACQDDDRFTADDAPVELLAEICRTCPLVEMCAEFAEIERPKAGVWAGKKYRTNQKRRSE